MTINERYKSWSNDRPHEDTGTFNVQLYDDDGLLLSEYTLDPLMETTSTLCIADAVARSEKIASYLGSTVIIVSQESLTNYQQVQVTVKTSLS